MRRLEQDLGTLGELHFGALPFLYRVADSPLLHLAVHGVHLHAGGGVDEAGVHVVDGFANHPGDHHGDVLGDGMTFLPGHIATVISVPGPDLLPLVIHLPDGGAVLLGDVLTLVYRLDVLLGDHRLVTLLQSLVLHDHLEIQAVLHVPVHRAIGEELHRTVDLRDGETHRPAGHLLALLVQLGPAHRQVLHPVVARRPVLQWLTEVLLASQH